MEPAKVLFDTDPGIDDAMALLFAHHSAAIDLLGITTVLGNGAIDTVTQNALYLCERFGITAPVHQGAAAPLQVAADAPPTFVHGADALGEVRGQTALRAPASTDAPGFLIETIRAHPQQITLVAVGRLTNLALALQRAPDITGLVKRVVVMGGALGHGGHTGNVTPVAEANMHGDPHAADQVFTAPWPVTMVGLDVTMGWFMHRNWLQDFAARTGETGQFIWEMTRFYDAFYAANERPAGFPVHDSSAVAQVIAPELFTSVQGRLRVVTAGIARGQTILVPVDAHFPPSAWDDQPIQQACIASQSQALLDLFASTFERI